MSPPRAFLLNDRPCALPSGERGLVLHWLRRRQGLVGTKEGCGEGECGACTVLLGEPDHPADPAAPLRYRAVCSCLLAVDELPGRHLVTIEGLNPPAGLNAVQQALVDAGAPQCGFCFPGIVVSLVGFFLTSRDLDREDAVAALDGNICRCTGYASILRAVDALCAAHAPRLDPGKARVEQLAAWNVVPRSFLAAAAELAALGSGDPDDRADAGAPAPVLCGGGTDLLVQRPDLPFLGAEGARVAYLSRRRELRTIEREAEHLVIGGGVPIEDLKHDPAFVALVPDAPGIIDRFASTIIRNRATVAGNLVNASPIGDVTVLLMALDAEAVLADAGGRRRLLPLRDLYLGYKKLALRPGEVMTAVRVPLSVGRDLVSYEKISQRRHLDIASVNSAARVALQGDGAVADLTLAIGGVAPIPLTARATMDFLRGRRLEAATVRAAADVLLGEIAPIDDVRGSAAYKRELARRVLYAHALRAARGSLRLEELA